MSEEKVIEKTSHVATFLDELGRERMVVDHMKQDESTEEFFRRCEEKIKPQDKFEKVSNYRPMTFGRITHRFDVSDMKSKLEELGYEIIPPEEKTREIQNIS